MKGTGSLGQNGFYLIPFTTSFPEEIWRRGGCALSGAPFIGGMDGCMETSAPGDPQSEKLPRLLGQWGRKEAQVYTSEGSTRFTPTAPRRGSASGAGPVSAPGRH